VDTIPDPLPLRKFGGSRNRTWDLWICGENTPDRERKRELKDHPLYDCKDHYRIMMFSLERATPRSVLKSKPSGVKWEGD
jgi:hypothetical protein